VAEYTGTFETGVNGAGILIGDAGSANAWNEAADPANVTLTYSNVQAYETLSCNITCNATGGQAYVGWLAATISPALSGTHYGRIYGFYSAAPSALHFWVRGLEVGRAWELRMRSTMLIELSDQGGTTRGVTTIPANINSWFRIEWRVVQSVTAGEIQLKLFNSPDSLTPTETVTTTGSFSTLAETRSFRFGSTATNIPNLLLYQDNILVNDTGYPGPLFPPVVSDENFAPVIYGRGAA
jgi:hypothetical protein